MSHLTSMTVPQQDAECDLQMNRHFGVAILRIVVKVFFEAFLLRVKKISLKERLIFSCQEFLGEEKLNDKNFFEYTMKEPERITPFRLSGIRVLQLQEFR